MQPAGFLKPATPSKVPFEQVGMNLRGPFSTPSGANRWIAVVTYNLNRQ